MPRVLASIVSRYICVALFIFPVALPLTTLYTPSANATPVGGNYTNVTGALGARIASAIGMTIRKEQKKRHLEQGIPPNG